MEEEKLENEKEFDIDIGKILYMFKKRILYIILGALIAGFIAGGYTELFITPKYSTSCTLYVYSNVDRVNTRSTINSSELEVSQKLVNTYIVVLKATPCLKRLLTSWVLI
jgi:capsular polysaccharide biosynthesis protein